jgi:hypothetical protein
VFAEEKERLLTLPATLPETDLVAPASVDTTAAQQTDIRSVRVGPTEPHRTSYDVRAVLRYCGFPLLAEMVRA